jgi:CubicO group peptidase (beta-lactamase class C family)
MYKAISTALAVVAVCCGQTGSPVIARLDQVVQTYAGDGSFMGAVLVARGEQVLFNKAYGSANLEWNIPNTSTSKFR